MPARHYLKNLGGAAKVGKLIGPGPSNHGATLDGITELRPGPARRDGFSA